MRRQDVYEKLDLSATRMGFTVADGEPLLYSAPKMTDLHFALMHVLDETVAEGLSSGTWAALIESPLGVFAMFRNPPGPIDWPVVEGQCGAECPPTRREYGT